MAPEAIAGRVREALSAATEAFAAAGVDTARPLFSSMTIVIAMKPPSPRISRSDSVESPTSPTDRPST